MKGNSMNLQQILEKDTERSALNLLPHGFNWYFIENSQRKALLRKLKRNQLVDKRVRELEDALVQLGFRRVPSYVELDRPSDERAYLLPPGINIPALLKAHGWRSE